MLKDRNSSTNIEQTLTYDQAKIDFARKGKIFRLLDCSHISKHPISTQANKIFEERSDFWIYETDTSAGGCVSPVYVDYRPILAHRIDTDAVSEARLKYINKQAQKKGLSLVDYAGGKRKILGWTCEFQQNAFRFISHCLQRYWERSRMGNGVNWFRDFPIDTVEWLWPYAQINDDDGYPIKIRRQYIPYEDGVFVAEILMTYVATITIDHHGNRTMTGHGVLQSEEIIGKGGVIGANCITFLHNDDLTNYQTRIVKAINNRDNEKYQQLIENDQMASYNILDTLRYEQN